ncbi:MAG TPA: metalloregulator ArsR/SmtB family transcription factor [Polyangiaceae bacterium]|nr:metalloregulator ArsR/SmtB family transcription factor [Polyangiaceae bacterium]
MTSTTAADFPRWELYKLLAEPVRVHLLALVAEEELAMGELAELLGESLTKVSRHASALRDAGLVTPRKHGTWVLLRLAAGLDADPVVQDALRAGHALMEKDGGRAKLDAVLRARDSKAREFFSRADTKGDASGPPRELGAYLAALAPLFVGHALAVDAGTGDGALLEVLAPVFDRVVALDRSDARLASAAARARARGLDNVRFVQGELDGPEVKDAVSATRHEGADLVFASRVLHHAPKPAAAVRALGQLLRKPKGDRPGGALVIVDYAPHDDLAMKEAQADLWLGFEPKELLSFAKSAGLSGAAVRPLPAAFSGDGPDKALTWQALTARRAN